MRIAQIAPLAEATPPRLYGGTERIVSYLTEELVQLGHEVTLFASGDSRTTARLVPCCAQALRLDPTVRDPLPRLLLMLQEVRRRAHEFDLLHFHLDVLHCPLFGDMAPRTVTTLHGRMDLPDLPPFYRAFSEFPLVSISHDQRRALPDANWLGTVHHGLPIDLLRPAATRGPDYLAFLGRISPEKRPDLAIEIARRSGVRLRIAAKVDMADREYFDETIRPLLDDPLIEFIGEIGETDKRAFLANARALLFPVDWPEPFGLVMIEAMACGTPVIAFRRGSVPEVIEEGLTGFIVDSVMDAARAVQHVQGIDRRRVRRRFEERFSAKRMARDYLELYSHAVNTAHHARRLVLRRPARNRHAMTHSTAEAPRELQLGS